MELHCSDASPREERSSYPDSRQIDELANCNQIQAHGACPKKRIEKELFKERHHVATRAKNAKGPATLINDALIYTSSEVDCIYCVWHVEGLKVFSAQRAFIIALVECSTRVISAGCCEGIYQHTKKPTALDNSSQWSLERNSLPCTVRNCYNLLNPCNFFHFIFWKPSYGL